MTQTTWIALIVAVTVIIALFIFRRQLKNFIFKINSGGVDAQLSTHPPQPGQEPISTSTASRGVKIRRNLLLGKRQRIAVQHDDAEVADSKLVGQDQDITVTTPDPHIATLHQHLTLNFSLNDFRTLCQHLQVNYDDLPGPDLDARASALLTHLHQQQRIPQLIDAGRRIHPELPWKAG